MMDLAIEAAMALDHLHLAVAKRLAVEAAAMVHTERGRPRLTTFPSCIEAQILYEDGHLDDAEAILCDRLSEINAAGTIECALRAYLVLAQIARQRLHFELAAILLHHGQLLGERRRWPRLVAACMAERTSLLLQVGRTGDARTGLELFKRYIQTHHPGSGFSHAEVTRYRTLAHWRIAWSECPSREAVAAMRQLYHRMLERRELYSASRLAVELSAMLAAIGEVDEADALFLSVLTSGAAAGLYQTFLEGGEESRLLVQRAYARMDATAEASDRQILPFLESLLIQWDVRLRRGALSPSVGRISEVLTSREHDILIKIGEGLANKRIARMLGISPETVKSHIKRIFMKLSVGSRTQAVSRARMLGLI
jgi:ATP/maltotriose-dependent transcriptional regulator MalT